ncbi:MAG TPA: DcaP family trimeric outer membrane transporter [Stellaceae bacterium]|nr:DcaP family trimeric outer membrane transporter [Stellaceae bacterium]
MKRRLGYTALTGALAALPFLLGAPDLAHAQQAPGSGSFPNSFLIPGTNTSLRVGGFVKLDVWYDFSVHSDTGTAGGTTGMNTGGLSLDNNVPGVAASQGHSFHGRMSWSAAESRFNFESRTPTAWGEVKTFLELDLEQPAGFNNSAGVHGNSDSIAPRLRQAYGTFGPWLFGQTFPLFSDGIASPETLDFAGSGALAGPLRIPEIRYTFDAGNGITLAAALDDESITFVNGITGGAGTSFSPCSGAADPASCVTAQNFATGSFSAPQTAGYKWPALIGNATLSQAWGHVSLRGLVRDLYYHGPSTVILGHDANIQRFGWGAGFSGDFHLPTGLKDAILWQANGGRGIGRFINNEGDSPGDFVIDPNGTPHLIDQYDATLGVIHYWTDQLRSNADGWFHYIAWPHGGGIFVAETPGSVFGGQNRIIYGSHANLLWSPIPAVDIGAEYIFLERKVEDGRQGIAHRLQFSTKFRF